MSYQDRLRVREYSHYLWVIGLILVGSMTFLFIKPKPKDNPANNDHECVEASEQGLAHFKKQFPQCTGNKPINAPNLYGHFLEQSLQNEICFEDVLYNNSGGLYCAPGPFLIEDKTVIDLDENSWKLSSSPNYFVWHLDKRAHRNDSFYITNQQGFPIKSQAVHLQNNDDATFVLLLKKPLVPGTKYYIYLTINDAEASQTWIQPLTIAVSAKLD